VTRASIAVLGAGAFGTALAIQLARRGARTLLWGRDPKQMRDIQATRTNDRRLPGCVLPAGVEATAGLADAVDNADDLLIATPSPALRNMCRAIAASLRPEHGIGCVSKGLEPGSGRLAHQVIAEELGASRAAAVVSGPTFARELALGLPTAVTVAANDAGFGQRLASALHGDNFRTYTSADLVGVEIGGAAKNVLAIAVGIADGMGLGANTRAAMITRGLGEIARLGAALGAHPETLMGLSGLGDLVLTCTDDHSRNRRYGLLLGRGQTREQAHQAAGAVVEGVTAAPEVLRLARLHRVNMPLLEMAGAVIGGSISAAEAVRLLVERPPRPEADGHPWGHPAAK
jgi:glycerol-3-phosphate dehydrogenase (NAD(P)+)